MTSVTRIYLSRDTVSSPATAVAERRVGRLAAGARDTWNVTLTVPPSLAPGQLSVGVGVDVKHLAATPVGMTARAVATYLGPEGKLHRFKVELHDDGGLAGEGEHTRAIIDEARLVAGAKSRGKPR